MTIHFAAFRPQAFRWLYALLLAVGLSVCQAAFKIDGNVIVAEQAGLKTSPVAAADRTTGRFLVVWSSEEAGSAFATPVHKVRARFIGIDGKPVGAGFVVSQRVERDSGLGGSNPSVAYNSRNKEFLVVYERGYTGSKENGLFGQRVAADGGLIGDELPLFPGFLQTGAVLAYDPNANRYLLVWQSGFTLVDLVLTGDGTPAGAASSPGLISAGHPAVVFDPDLGRYLLVFDAPVSTGTDVFGQFIDAGGVPSGGVFPIAEAESGQQSPVAAWDSVSRRYLVAWTDGRDSTETTPGVFAQLLEQNGSPFDRPIRLAKDAVAPQLVFAPEERRFLFTFVDAVNGSTSDGFLFGQLLKPDANADGDGFKISETRSVTAPFAAIDPASSRTVAVWLSGTQASDSKVVAQSLNAAPIARNLVLKVKDKPDPVVSGQPLTYTIRLTNNGSVAARAVVLTDTLPQNVVYGSAEPTQGNCALENRTVTCTLGSLPAGGTFKVVLTVTPLSLGTIKNKVAVTWANGVSDSGGLAKQVATTVRYAGQLRLLSPNGGEVIPSGATADVLWEVPGAPPEDVLQFALAYSLNNGTSWTTFARGVNGTAYGWPVPSPPGNRSKVRVRVTGFSQDGRKIGGDRSDRPFVIEVVRLDSPNGGEALRSGAVQTIVWTTRSTRSPVARVRLSLSVDGGNTWQRIAVLDGNPGRYDWIVPERRKPTRNAKIRVVLSDGGGTTVGSDNSDGAFSIDR